MTTDELDRVVGTLYQTVEHAFPALIRLGFARRFADYTRRVRTFSYGESRSPLILEVLWVGRIGEVGFPATRAPHLAPASKEHSTGMHSVASSYG